MPSLSFIMPAWKSAHLYAAIRSILDQSSNDWELVVIDDCSPEDLKGIVDSFKDTRIRYYRNEKNLGGKDLVRQWNHCLEFAIGDYIALAADDDIYAPEFCEECLRLAEKYPQVDVIRSAVEQIDEDGKHLWDDNTLPEFTDQKEYFELWIRGKVFSCIGNFAFKRIALERIGGFMSFPCGFGSDIATPIELSANGVANTDRMLYRFRQGTEHLSADSSRYEEKIKAIGLLSDYLKEKNSTLNVFEIGYLEKKCIYDYFNLVIKNLPFSKLGLIWKCQNASFSDKCIMILRWIMSLLFYHK